MTLTIGVEFTPILRQMIKEAPKIPRFLDQMSLMLVRGEAIEVTCRRDRVIVHPSDELLEWYYQALNI